MIRPVRRALALLGFPALLTAQSYSPLTIGADVMTTRAVRDVATTQVLSGTVLGARASVAFTRLQIEGQYSEGLLSPDGVGSSATEDYVDARVTARLRVTPWLSVGAGPHLRAFVTPSGTARWSRIEVHARFTSELINDIALLVFDTWYAPTAESSVQGGGTGARGGEAGVFLRIPGTPSALHLSYLADRGTFSNGGGEFVEGVRAAIVLDRIVRTRAR